MNKKSLKSNSVLIVMIIITIILGILTITFFVLDVVYSKGWMKAIAITLLTFFYHLGMRLLVGEIVTISFKNREFPLDRMGFRMYKFEDKLYSFLKVKRWKASVLTAKKDQFDLKVVSPRELLHNVMQAELVHRIIVVLSLLPILLIIPFGEPLVFVITSVLSSIIDLVFVVIQRYNRPRVLRYIEHSNRILSQK